MCVLVVHKCSLSSSTLLHTPCYKAASSLKQSVRGQYICPSQLYMPDTVKIMSSKKQTVLDSKACIDSWSINEVKTFFAYSIAKNRNRNVQVILYIEYGQTATLWKVKNKVFDKLKAEELWISNHNGPTEIVETTQIGFFAGVRPELYREGWEDNINRQIKEYFKSNSGEMIL
jgi:hypothetical protein